MSNDDEHLLVPKNQESQLAEAKAYFFQEAVTPDNTTKVYPKDVVISLDDIYELNERVCEKFATYENAGFLVKVHIKYTNKKENEFSSWTAFTNHKWYESESVNNIVITWTFNAKLPNYTFPRKHILVVKFSNRMRPEEMLKLIFSGGMEDIDEIDRNFFPVIASVDFIDRLLGDELLNIVGDWVSGLNDTTINRSKFVLFLKKHKRKVAYSLEYITKFVLMFSVVYLYNSFLDSLKIKSLAEIQSGDLKMILNGLISIAFVWITSDKISKLLATKTFKVLQEYGDSYLFNITKGDAKKQSKMQKQERYDRMALTATLLGAFAINIVSAMLEKIIF